MCSGGFFSKKKTILTGYLFGKRIEPSYFLILDAHQTIIWLFSQQTNQRKIINGASKNIFGLSIRHLKEFRKKANEPKDTSYLIENPAK